MRESTAKKNNIRKIWGRLTRKGKGLRGVPWPKSGGGTRTDIPRYPLVAKSKTEWWKLPRVSPFSMQKVFKIDYFTARPEKNRELLSYVDKCAVRPEIFYNFTLRQPHRHPKMNKIFTLSRAGGDLSPRSLPHGTPMGLLHSYNPPPLGDGFGGILGIPYTQLKWYFKIPVSKIQTVPIV